MRKWFSVMILVVIFISLIISSPEMVSGEEEKHNYIVRLERPEDFSFSDLKADDGVGTMSETSGGSEAVERLESVKREIEDEIRNEDVFNVFLQEDIGIKEFRNVLYGFSVEMTEKQAESLREIDGVESINREMEVSALLDDSVEMIQEGIEAGLLDKYGRDCTSSGNDCLVGENITIAVIDTGVDYRHQDFGNCTEDEFLDGECQRVIGGYDYVNNNNNPMDDDGHGTHVASIAAGNGTLKGVAPEARILAYKALDDQGDGSMIDVISAIEDAVDDGADILVLSLGADCGGSYDSFCGPADDTSVAVNDAFTEYGVVSAVAAGNAGSDESTIASPGTAEYAFTVGSVTKLDSLASTSSRGPVNDTDNDIHLVKPDILAPGQWIKAAQYDTEDGYTSKGGTSMAAPHVAGAFALMKQARPHWDVSLIKEILTGSAIDLDYDENEQGQGRINLTAALQYAKPPFVSIDSPEEDAYNFFDHTLEISYHGQDLDEVWYEFDGINNTYEGPVNITLEEGENVIRAWANESILGEKNMTEKEVYVDRSAPDINIVNPPNETVSSRHQVIDILVEDVDPDEIWYTWQGISTNETYTEPTNITFNADETNVLDVWANNTLGNVSHTNVSFDVNYSAPLLEIISPEEGIFDFSEHTVSINASDPELDEVWYSWNGSNITYTEPHMVDFSDGNLTLSAWARDVAGNVNHTNISFDIDTTPPNTTASSDDYKIGEWTNRNVTVELSCQDEVSGCSLTEYCIGSGCDSWKNYTSPFEISENGTTGFRYRSIDNLNNTEDVNEDSVRIDRSEPNISIESPSNGTNYTTSDVAIEYDTSDSISGINESSCRYSINGSEASECPSVLEDLEDGSHELLINISDNAGNIANDSVTFRVNEPPSYSDFDVSLPSLYNESNVYRFNISLTDNTAVDSGRLHLYNSSNESVYNLSTSDDIYWTENLTGVLPGRYRYSFWANDTSGNEWMSSNSSFRVRGNLSENERIIDNSSYEVDEGAEQLISDDLDILVNISVKDEVSGSVLVDILNNHFDNRARFRNNSTFMRNVSGDIYSVFIPGNSSLSLPDGWDGNISMPELVDSGSLEIPEDTEGDVDSAVSFGYDSQIDVDNPSRVVLPGMAGKDAAWTSGNELNEIDTECDNLTSPSNIDPDGTKNCYIDDGNDMVIWTYHFSTFAAGEWEEIDDGPDEPPEEEDDDDGAMSAIEQILQEEEELREKHDIFITTSVTAGEQNIVSLDDISFLWDFRIFPHTDASLEIFIDDLGDYGDLPKGFEEFGMFNISVRGIEKEDVKASNITFAVRADEALSKDIGRDDLLLFEKDDGWSELGTSYMRYQDVYFLYSGDIDLEGTYIIAGFSSPMPEYASFSIESEQLYSPPRNIHDAGEDMMNRVDTKGLLILFATLLSTVILFAVFILGIGGMIQKRRIAHMVHHGADHPESLKWLEDSADDSKFDIVKSLVDGKLSDVPDFVEHEDETTENSKEDESLSRHDDSSKKKTRRTRVRSSEGPKSKKKGDEAKQKSTRGSKTKASTKSKNTSGKKSRKSSKSKK